MPNDPLHRLPGEVTVDLEEVRALIVALELLQRALVACGADADVVAVDDLIGQVLRWLWPILDDLDEEWRIR